MTRCVRVWSLKSLGKHYRRLLHYRSVLARHLASGHQSSVPSTEEDHDDAFDRENEARANDQNISSGVNAAGDYDEEETQAAWVLSSGDLQKEQKTCSTNRQRSSFSVGFSHRQKWRDRTFPDPGWSCGGS